MIRTFTNDIQWMSEIIEGAYDPMMLFDATSEGDYHRCLRVAWLELCRIAKAHDPEHFSLLDPLRIEAEYLARRKSPAAAKDNF